MNSFTKNLVLFFLLSLWTLKVQGCGLDGYSGTNCDQLDPFYFQGQYPLKVDVTGACQTSSCCCLSGTLLVKTVPISGSSFPQITVSGSVSGQCQIPGTPAPTCSTNSACAGNGNSLSLGGTTYCCAGTAAVNYVQNPDNSVTCTCGSGTPPQAAPSTFTKTFTPSTTSNVFTIQPFQGANYQVTMDFTRSIAIQDLSTSACNNYGSFYQQQSTFCMPPTSSCSTNQALVCPDTALHQTNNGNCINIDKEFYVTSNTSTPNNPNAFRDTVAFYVDGVESPTLNLTVGKNYRFRTASNLASSLIITNSNQGSSNIGQIIPLRRDGGARSGSSLVFSPTSPATVYYQSQDSAYWGYKIVIANPSPISSSTGTNRPSSSSSTGSDTTTNNNHNQGYINYQIDFMFIGMILIFSSLLNLY